MAASRRGMILILSSPSGAGQDHADPDADPGQRARSDALGLGDDAQATLVRSRRHPLSLHADRAEFERMKAAGELLESAEVHGHGYGTPRAPVEKVLAEGRDMLFDIDWQGAKQVRERLGDDVVSIFVLPPSMRELRARLERRAEDTASSIEARFENARTGDRALARLPLRCRQRRPQPRLSRREDDRRRRAAAREADPAGRRAAGRAADGRER